MNTRKFISIPALIALAVLAFGQAFAAGPDKPGPGKGNVVTVAFYNMENLFDAVDDPAINDEEFLPNGANQWTEERYKHKLANMSKVISQLGSEDGPDVLGMCEVENKKVLEDLIATQALKKKGYGIIHSNSPDQRGIDCAFLYRVKRFTPLYQQAYTVPFPENKDLATRDILLVKGILDKKHDVTFIVNHWPSRREGQQESSWKRERAAQTLRTAIDSILGIDPYANIVMMGDFNDEPLDISMNKTLKAGRDSVEACATLLYNCMASIKAEGRGTLKFKGGWNLFDQMIVSTAMITKKSLLQYQKGSANVFNPDWMRQVNETGDWKDAPKRTFIGKKYMEDGFSDHFPVYINLVY
ncbi:MAG: endonuclease/exonuclease/phosphatase family protein [Bacteroidia bacterium]